MNEEKYIEEQVGRRNPFTVPEGYLMRYAAALVCVLAMGAMAWFALSSSPDVHQPLQVEAVQVSGDAAFDEAADYAMIDNYDIYACLSEE